MLESKPGVTWKAPKYYPADDVPVKAQSTREAASRGISKLRKSITPGTVLILLAGRFRGRRVVFLKQLPSGLLLVTGPYSVNGIPVRRVNQAYVIATSAKVDVSKCDTSKFKDDYFGKAKLSKNKSKNSNKKGDAFFAGDEEKSELSAERKADQAKLESTLVPVINKTDMMSKYLKSRFTLSKAQAPHNMKF